MLYGPSNEDCQLGLATDGCHRTIGNWVDYDSTLTWGANVIILLVVISLVYLLFWYVFSYRRRPFCVDCLEQNKKVRTRSVYEGEPVCTFHFDQREMNDESTYECPKHGTALEKVKHDDVTIDQCEEGCVFLDDGELSRIVASARTSGHAAGQTIGTAVGMSIGKTF
jgi:hypothetical protein